GPVVASSPVEAAVSVAVAASDPPEDEEDGLLLLPHAATSASEATSSDAETARATRLMGDLPVGPRFAQSVSNNYLMCGAAHLKLRDGHRRLLTPAPMSGFCAPSEGVHQHGKVPDHEEQA